MLYVSRYVGQTKYGVVDTDDGVETVVSFQDLADYVLVDGLDIKGVNIDYIVRRNKQVPFVRSITVYQEGSFLTARQAKTKTLKGIDVIVNNGRIAQITVGNGGLKQETRLKLSDYGTSCGEYILKNLNYLRDNRLIIELDDGIAVGPKTFKYYVNRGVVLDMTAVKNSKTVEYIAHELSSSERWLENPIAPVIDTPQRMDFYIAETILNRSINSLPQIKSIRELVSDPVAVNALIAKKHRSEFKGVSRAQFLPGRYFRGARDTKRFVGWLAGFGWLTKCDNYETLVNKNCINILACLRECSTCNNNVLLRFENYIRFFTPTDEIKKAFVQLCQSAGKWLLDLGLLEGWIMEVVY